MNVIQFCDKRPKISDQSYIAPNAQIIGDVQIDAQASIWFGSVIRGDVEKIVISSGTNVQDNCTIHVNRDNGPTIIGKNVTIGHNCLIHACKLKDFSFIGMSATVMDFAVVEKFGMLAAGSLLTSGKKISSRELWIGSPAKFSRSLTTEEINWIEESAKNYIELSKKYK